MKIATKKGDDLTTSLLFDPSRRAKSEFIFELIGSYDELSSFIGLLKVKIKNEESRLSRYFTTCEAIQLDLIKIMGEFNASCPEDRNQYFVKYDALKESDYCQIDEEVSFLQDLKELKQTHWVLYGKTEVGALADICSKVARRAERNLAVQSCYGDSLDPRSVIKKYTNRLSDLFYLIARLSDHILKQ